MKKKLSLERMFPYLPKIWASMLYFVLLIAAMFIFWGRTNENVRIPLLLNVFPDYYTHISNFSLSFMLCLSAGYTNITKTNKLNYTVFIAGLLLIANFIYEWFLPFANTRDKTDAYYGFAGTLLPFVYFFFYRKYGLKPNPKFEGKMQESGIKNE